MSELPSKTELSETFSKYLKKRGINFVGSTITHAFMQAVGIVNDRMGRLAHHDACVAGRVRSCDAIKKSAIQARSTVLAGLKYAWIYIGIL